MQSVKKSLKNNKRKFLSDVGKKILGKQAPQEKKFFGSLKFPVFDS